MKTWLVRVYCGYGEEIYVAYDESDPIENGHIRNEDLDGIYEYLWDSYGYLLTDHTDADPEEDEEAYEEEVDKMYEDFMCDTGAYAEEMSIEEIKQYTPGGNDPEIIYDGRNEK